MRKLFIVILSFMMVSLFALTTLPQAATAAETVATGQDLLLVGDIEARAAVMVFPRIPGKIQELNVEIGDSVRKGDVLAVVEHKELELGVRQAKAVLENGLLTVTVPKIKERRGKGVEIDIETVVGEEE